VDAGRAMLVRVAVEQGRAIGMRLPEARLRDVTFTDTQLDLANLRFAQLERVVFRGCQLREADLMSARLTSVVFEGCDLTGIDLARVSFERCELRGCTLDEVRGLTSLTGVAMSWPDVIALAPVLAAAFGVH